METVAFLMYSKKTLYQHYFFNNPAVYLEPRRHLKTRSKDPKQKPIRADVFTLRC